MKAKLRKTIFIVCLAVFFCCLGGVGYILLRSYQEGLVDDQVAGLVNTETPAPTAEAPASPTATASPRVMEKYAQVYEANPETIGWLEIPNSTINLVVMQTPDEPDKYLHLDFYGNYSANGTLYLDARCDIWESDNLLIYGHHMATGAMFGSLMAYANESYWQEHRTFSFDTIYEEGEYEVVAACYARLMNKSEEGFRYYYFFGSESREEFNVYRDFIEENRCYDTGVEIEYGDRLVTLSTCAYHVQNGRFFVVARRTNDDPVPDDGDSLDAGPVEIALEPAPLAAAPAEPDRSPGGQAIGVSTELALLGMGLIIASTGVLTLSRKKKS